MHDSFHCLNFDMTHGCPGQCIVFRNVTPAFTIQWHSYIQPELKLQFSLKRTWMMMVGQRMVHEREDRYMSNKFFDILQLCSGILVVVNWNTTFGVQCTLAARITTKFYCSNKFILMSVLLSFDSSTHKYKLPTDELWTLCACSCLCSWIRRMCMQFLAYRVHTHGDIALTCVLMLLRHSIFLA